MSNIITVIDSVIGELNKFKGLAVEMAGDISKQNESLAVIKSEQDIRQKALDIREAEIKKVEDIVKLEAETKVLLSDAEKASRELATAQKAFKETAVSENKALAEQAAKNERERIRNEAETKDLIRVREGLEKEKSEFKLKLAQGLVNQADKLQ